MHAQAMQAVILHLISLCFRMQCASLPPQPTCTGSFTVIKQGSTNKLGYLLTPCTRSSGRMLHMMFDRASTQHWYEASMPVIRTLL